MSDDSGGREETVGEPTRETFEAILRDRGLTMPEDRLVSSVELHAKLRSELDRLRSVRLEFLPPYVEPATALQWIENGGHSVEHDE